MEIDVSIEYRSAKGKEKMDEFRSMPPPKPVGSGSTWSTAIVNHLSKDMVEAWSPVEAP